MQSKVLILDFGSQVTKLIARNIRELNVYCEISRPGPEVTTLQHKIGNSFCTKKCLKYKEVTKII